MGYNTDSITKGNFNAIGINWTAVDGSGFQLSSLTGEGLHGAITTSEADQIMIWDPATSGYEVWYYYVDASDSTHAYDGWWDLDTQMKTFAEVHPTGLSNGSSVWYLSASGSNGGAATASGAVDADSTVTLTLTKGNFNQISNPYPDGLKLDDSTQVDWSNATGSTMTSTSDQIMIWDPTTSGYEVWYYYVDASDSTHAYDGWWDLDTQMKTFVEVHPDGLAVGTPVWYLAVGTFGDTFDVTFKTPVK